MSPERVLCTQSRTESMRHHELKKTAIRILQGVGCKPIYTEAPWLKDRGRIDVVGILGTISVAIECGECKWDRILRLQQEFDVVVHLPYSWTPKLVISEKFITDRLWWAIRRVRLRDLYTIKKVQGRRET